MRKPEDLGYLVQQTWRCASKSSLLSSFSHRGETLMRSRDPATSLILRRNSRRDWSEVVL